MPARCVPDDARLILSQARSRELARMWRQIPAYRHAEALFAPGARADAAPSADTVAEKALRLFSDGQWAAEMLSPLAEALGEDPWIEPPLRADRDELRQGALLFESPVVAITASLLSASALAAIPRATTLVVPGRLSVVRYVRGGDATLLLWRAEPARDDFARDTAAPCLAAGAVRLRDGLVRRIDGRTHAQLIERATGDIVTLSATIRVDAAPLMREYARTDGSFLRAAAIDDGDARTAMLAALLRHLGHADRTAFDTASRDPSPFVRWDVMREWLAFDVAGAFPRLCELENDPNAEVRAAAIAMRRHAEAMIACRR